MLIAATESESLDADNLTAEGAIPRDIDVDLVVADGGAASQLFALDTQVTTPLVVGDHSIDGTTESYTIANLDEDVVTIALGSSSLGVLGISAFVNNGDGTGSFIAQFDPSFTTRQLTIVATDDVDNESAESPIFLVYDVDALILNESVSIAPQDTVSTATCNRLLDAIPESNFILKRASTVPYSYGDTAFDLRAVTPGDPVTLRVVRKGLPGEPDESQGYVVIPENSVETVALRLGRGLNIITAIDVEGRSDTIIVAATTYATVMCAYAREIYNFSQVQLDEQTAAIYSPVSTRIAEPLIPFSDLLPDVRSLQTLATKLLVRSMINNPGAQSGVQDVLSSLTLSTPVFVQQRPDQEFFEPRTRPLFNDAEAFGGVEAHAWLGNRCVATWLAFLNYLSSIDVHQIVRITEDEVVFLDDGGALRRHVFDFTDDNCSVINELLETFCFENVTMTVAIYSITSIYMCAAQYPLDFTPGPAYPLHPLENEAEPDGIDPGFDGYVDFSLTDHWDSGGTLDSMGPNPSVDSGLSPCVYDTYLVVPLTLASVTPEINVGMTATGTATVLTARAAQIDISIGAATVEITSDITINIGLPLYTCSIDFVVQAEESITAEISVAISG